MSNRISPGVATIIIVVVVLIAGLIIWKFSTHEGHPPTAEEWQQITQKAGAAEAQQNAVKPSAPAQSANKPSAKMPTSKAKGQ